MRYKIETSSFNIAAQFILDTFPKLKSLKGIEVVDNELYLSVQTLEDLLEFQSAIDNREFIVGKEEDIDMIEIHTWRGGCGNEID